MPVGTDTRQGLVDTARGLFHASSYADVGVQTICREAGVQKGSFYHFFPSKQELTLAVLDDIERDFMDQFLAVALADDLPPMQRLLRFAGMIYEDQQQCKLDNGHMYGCPFGNLALELSTRDDAIRKRVERLLGRVIAKLEALLIDSRTAGELADTVDIQATAVAMMAYLEGVMLVAKSRNEPELIRSLAPAVASVRVALPA